LNLRLLRPEPWCDPAFLIEPEGFAESAGHPHVIVCCSPPNAGTSIVYDSARGRPSRAPPFSAPDANELQELVEQIAARVGQVLERRGLIERDIENA
jgi:hypothetical protein